MEEFHINILNISAVLLAAYLGGVAIRKIGYPAILGELLIGIVLGPAVLGWLEYSEAVKVLAEIGIILLMVYIGMEIDFRDLKKASWAGLLAAIGGFFVPFVLGYFAIVWSGGTPIAGLFVAIAIGVTSLATKSRILIDLKLLNTRIAYVLMAGALISDTLALVIFSGITNFAETNVVKISELLLIGGKILVFFGLTISIGVFFLPRLGKYITRSGMKNSTAYFTLILIVTFGYCELAELAGMHSILGAFMAGLFIKDNLFPKTISKELNKAFYDVSIGFMAPIFFVTAGFFVDVTVFQTDLGLLILVTFLAIVGKIVGTALFYLPSRNGWREGITIGTGMNGRGAVEIIIAEIGLEMGIIDKTIFSILVFMAIFTTLTVPVFLNWTTKWLRKRGELVYMDERRGIVFLGVNPLSLILAKYFKEQEPVTLIDNNRELAAKANKAGFKSIYGNALIEETWEETRADSLAAFVALTTNNQVNLRAAQTAKSKFLVPEVVVAISAAGQTSNVTEESDKRNILFASAVSMNVWFQKIQLDKAEENTILVTAPISCKQWIHKYKIDTTDTLPILIRSEKGRIRLFSSASSLQTNDRVVILKAEK
ncbi:cation:proton antiporter [Draconibacterium halophilum]|uniref:Sodium:proton exchanger n=1 Tax=Draconibacterium halophilum TaxID=2706887 RepID=A0A6C0RHK7_9BACT|nr:cation:proton antiporter [Draconibacterium halophilum]QIA09537.1 sodium:proton exchanger [Draconibacterium halophilum]